MAVGRIHSVESMGLVDGPGIRYVVFMQGCALRCKYCHNPDTWHGSGGQEMTSEELFEKILRFRSYFESSGGGVTFSGGEPLLQPTFLKEMLTLCKEAGIHTAIDTAGGSKGDFGEILDLADMLLLDIKHTNDDGYHYITARKMDMYNNFKKQIREHPLDIWVRAVIIPGINDNIDYIREIWSEAKSLPRVKKIELLPYHTLGVNKYERLRIPYPLEGVPPMDKRHVAKWQYTLNQALMADL